jgi:glycosyltransferase involved in cell wall biosynthesis
MAERPRVLFLGPDVPGGMSASIRALLASPLAEEFELEFVATHRGAFGPLRRIGVFGAALGRLAWWSLRGRGRIVHVHGTKRGSMFRKALCVLVAKTLGRRVVLHHHSGPGDIASFRAGLGRGAVAFLRLGMRRADVLVAVSAASAAALRDAFAVGPIDVIPNLTPRPPAATAGATGDADPVVAYLGGFANPVKGGEILLEAIAAEELGGYRFLLAGPGALPDAGRRLLAGRPKVRWEGWLDPDEKDAALREAEVFVLSSTSEGLPMALLEAMSYGLAILATAVGGVPDTVESGTQALVVAPGDPIALRRGLAELLGDPALRRRLGEAALLRAERFSPERVASEFAAVYRELLREDPA